MVARESGKDKGSPLLFLGADIVITGTVVSGGPEETKGLLSRLKGLIAKAEGVGG